MLMRPFDVLWFRTRRKELGITTAGIAASIGTNQSTVSRLLSGHRPMYLHDVPALAAALSVSPVEIIERAGLDLGLSVPDVAGQHDDQ